MQLYEALEVEKGASADEIKRSYRKLAMKYHPDKVDEDKKEEAEERFKRITEAYTVLSDDEKRRQYDLTGSAEGFGGHPFGDPTDIFKHMFGGFGGGGMFGGGHGFGGHGHAPRRQDVLRCQVSLEEVYTGVTKRIEYDVTCLCHQCNGRGAENPDDVINCLMCQGMGGVTKQLGPMLIQSTCPSCQGKKKAIRANRCCSNCRGEGVAPYKKTVKLALPRGIPHGHESRLSGKGNYDKDTKQTNDLVVLFEYSTVATVSGSDIHYGMTITLEELLCGFVKPINLYGVQLKIASYHYFNPNKPATFPKRGLPFYKDPSSYGNLIVKFTVQYPEDDKDIHKYHEVYLKIYKKLAIKEEEDQDYLWISKESAT